MFTPSLDLDVIYRCGYFRITDDTGPDTGDGTKWDGVSGLDSSTVTEAIIDIVFPSGNETSIDVSATIVAANPITDDVDLGDHAGTYPDGLYNLVYKIKTDTFAITAFADYGATVPGTVSVTAAGHALETGEYVIITGSTNYNGTYQITKIDNNTFYIFATWVVNDGACTGRRYYLSTFYPYVYCNLEAYRDRMYARIAQMTPGDTRDKWKDDARKVDDLLMCIKSAISSANITALSNLQAEANQIIDFYDIDTSV